ncbi:hypothetical protein PtB15_1B34 [Puccinia triticina]|nr:hypothetical protein PtB15_1B34 [Puccinia triticina]
MALVALYGELPAVGNLPMQITNPNGQEIRIVTGNRFKHSCPRSWQPQVVKKPFFISSFYRKSS